ncbi:putative vesicular glutamate transporter eat-4 [Babylonia areolata]|uniref:putative vesicular glutamate transporter eat-4 n=1 Tax=Babylonia areolata TaxID=304850 RepID=UPI003FD085DE
MAFSVLSAGSFFAPAISSAVTATTICYVKWDAVFYIIGGGGMLWTVVWFRHFHDRPELHPGLTSEERDYFRKYGTNVRQGSVELFRKAPWKSILTSGGVWAAVTAGSVRTVANALLTLQQFQYFQDAFNVMIEDVGFLQAVPYVLFGVTSMVGGVVSRKLITCGLSTTATRKTVSSACFVTVGACMTTVYFLQDWVTAFVLLSAAAAMQGFGAVGFNPLMSDMTPQYTGIVYGIVITVSNLAATLSSTFISMTAGKYQSLESWQTVYLLSGVMYFVACALFGILADASLQPWAEGTQSKENQNTDVEEDSDSDATADSSTTYLLAAYRR